MTKREKLLLRKVWLSMKARCFYSWTPDYKNYGGRGITVCPAWTNSFETFLADMGPRPEKYRLERKDNNGNYTPENCIWADCTRQTHNQRLRCDNTSGLKGVTWDSSKSRWFVRGVSYGTYTFLYQGPDFFEACCARKSWENKHGVGS